MKDNKASLSSMASKFADKDAQESSSEDDASSFEEVPKPIERPRAAAAAVSAAVTAPRTATPTPTPAPSQPEPQIQRSAPAPQASSSSSSSDSEAAPAPAAQAATTSLPTRTPTSGGGPATAAEGLRAHLQDIKGMLEAQQQLILAQNDKIEALTKEVATLKEKL